MQVLSNKKIANRDILHGLLTDLQGLMEGSYLTLPEVQSAVKSLDGLGLISDDSANLFVDYLVNKGYDADDYANILGLAKGTSLIHRLCCANEVGNKIKSTHFIVHIEEFIRENLKKFTAV